MLCENFPMCIIKARSPECWHYSDTCVCPVMHRSWAVKCNVVHYSWGALMINQYQGQGSQLGGLTVLSYFGGYQRHARAIWLTCDETTEAPAESQALALLCQLFGTEATAAEFKALALVPCHLVLNTAKTALPVLQGFLVLQKPALHFQSPALPAVQSWFIVALHAAHVHSTLRHSVPMLHCWSPDTTCLQSCTRHNRGSPSAVLALPVHMASLV